jgi:ATP-dependent RNA helicase DDX54/DBP10
MSVAKFRNRVTQVMIVTDLAARGIDIPMLDNVINYNFPAKSKLFVHRVGECNNSFILSQSRLGI